jgi:hypothetical protein
MPECTETELQLLNMYLRGEGSPNDRRDVRKRVLHERIERLNPGLRERLVQANVESIEAERRIRDLQLESGIADGEFFGELYDEAAQRVTAKAEGKEGAKS